MVTDNYVYDGDGRRVARISAGQTTRYVLDPTGGDLYSLLAETDGSNNPLRYYLYGEGLVAQITGNSHRYYHFDQTGNTLALTNDSGAVTDKYAYEPFGISTAQGGSYNPFRFVGKFGVMDDNNGLNYMRARYYRPELARFVGLDAVYGDAKEPMTLNRYIYAKGNPIKGIDPTGRTAEDDIDDVSFAADFSVSMAQDFLEQSKSVSTVTVIKNGKIWLRTYTKWDYTRKARANISFLGTSLAVLTTSITVPLSVYPACRDGIVTQECVTEVLVTLTTNAAVASAGFYCQAWTKSNLAGMVCGTVTDNFMDWNYKTAYETGVMIHKMQLLTENAASYSYDKIYDFGTWLHKISK